MRVSLQFIADEAKVSKSLVSKVLNGKDVRVSRETRENIVRLSQQYNYSPNRIAAGLRTNKTNIIGCIMPGIYTDFFAELVYSIESTAQRQGYQTVLCNTGEDITLERKYLELYRSGMFDGMIVNPSDNSANLDLFKIMKKQGFPFVFVDRHIGDIDVSYACSDGYRGGYLLTEKLLDKGHKHVLFLAHGKSRNTSVQTERFSGYEQAMKDRGLDASRVFMAGNPNVKEREIYELFSQKNRPTGIVLVSSWDINYILEVCAELSIGIPVDIEMATFDRFSVSYSNSESIALAKNILVPPIIAEQNTKQMGEKAVELLCENIGNTNFKTSKVLLQPKIINI